ncbi:hypothetical protein BKA62DRAFT_296793 [Auriculariales sp. MPI-PUGE-AT-0066]|nr:hypothetical protein BKA62DRAFT_296793 [Auriculariales sp. MPI-PUGE-AT-0066]
MLPPRPCTQVTMAVCLSRPWYVTTPTGARRRLGGQITQCVHNFWAGTFLAKARDRDGTYRHGSWLTSMCTCACTLARVLHFSFSFRKPPPSSSRWHRDPSSPQPPESCAHAPDNPTLSVCGVCIGMTSPVHSDFDIANTNRNEREIDGSPGTPSSSITFRTLAGSGALTATVRLRKPASRHAVRHLRQLCCSPLPPNIGDRVR